MGALNKSLRDWLKAYANGGYVPNSILAQLKDSSLIPHRDWTDAWNRRAQFTAPLEHIFDRLEHLEIQTRYLEERLAKLENKKGDHQTGSRPLVKARRRFTLSG